MSTIIEPKDSSSDYKKLWDELLAYKTAKLLEGTFISPNHITYLAFILTILFGTLFSIGEVWSINIAAFLVMIVRFLDHLDGEVARLKKSESKFGHYLDWFVDTFSYSILIISLAIGFRNKFDSTFILILVIIAVVCCLINTVRGIASEIDESQESRSGFPSYGGFAMDDGVYLIGPITWFGFLYPFFLLIVGGAILYLLATLLMDYIFSSRT